tara:strand:- start:7671 stop:8855 length:1185 start_codon:yes stop_codon:yes gene_type:complete
MLKKFFNSFLIIFFLVGCETTSPITNSMSYEELELDASTMSTKLDINVVELDPGLYGDDAASRDRGIWPELRRAESRRFAVKMMRSLNETNAFANVTVTTSSDFLSDIVITGQIKESNGEDLNILINATDSTGKPLIKNKLYKHRTNEYFYQNLRNKDKDPFDSLYRSIAGDIIKELKKRNLEEIELITDLRFAQKLNDIQFYDALDSENNRYSLGFVPAMNDPMFIRAQNVQIKDAQFRNEMQKHYISFSDTMDESYKIWQEASLKASKQKREAERAAAGKALLGALIVAAAASSYDDSDYYDYNIGETVAATMGAALLVSAVGDSQQAKVHESTINEVSKSFDGEIAPQVVEMEGLQVKLEGNIQNQFDQWQTILADIYESESSQTNDFEIL